MLISLNLVGAEENKENKMDNKVSEKVYILDDNTEMIVLGNIIFNGIRYLLLNKDSSDEYGIAYEDSGDLVFVEESDSNYSEILNMLVKEINRNI